MEIIIGPLFQAITWVHRWVLGTACESTTILAELFVKGNRRHRLLFSGVRWGERLDQMTFRSHSRSQILSTLFFPLTLYYQTKASWKHARHQWRTLPNIDFYHSNRDLENNIKKWFLKIGTLKLVLRICWYSSSIQGLFYLFFQTDRTLIVLSNGSKKPKMKQRRDFSQTACYQSLMVELKPVRCEEGTSLGRKFFDDGIRIIEVTFFMKLPGNWVKWWGKSKCFP